MEVLKYKPNAPCPGSIIMQGAVPEDVTIALRFDAQIVMPSIPAKTANEISTFFRSIIITLSAPYIQVYYLPPIKYVMDKQNSKKTAFLEQRNRKLSCNKICEERIYYCMTT